jgi:hypothetical protein
MSLHHKFLPMSIDERYPTVVRLAAHGGFCLRDCPDPEELARLIVRSCNRDETVALALRRIIVGNQRLLQHDGTLLMAGEDLAKTTRDVLQAQIEIAELALEISPPPKPNTEGVAHAEDQRR